MVRDPYGCVEDETLRPEWLDARFPTPVRCINPIVFDTTRFDRRAHFSAAEFDNLADFRGVHFEGRVYFKGARFSSPADFGGARFDSLAIFSEIQFLKQADFSSAQFDSVADFRTTDFDSSSVFSRVLFGSRANFFGAQFGSEALFNLAQFDSLVDFSYADFWGPVYFNEGRFDSGAIADFTQATVRNILYLGNKQSQIVQRLDFRRVHFLPAGRAVRTSRSRPGSDAVRVRYPGATVILNGPVELQMQRAKFGFLRLDDNLGYFEKQDIIAYLKQESFSGEDQSLERFELDYLLARSTMRQKKASTREVYPAYHPVLWGNYLYYATMGLGYRPFWIFGWAGLMILIFAVYYRRTMPLRIYDFVQDNKPRLEPEPPQEAPTWDITVGKFRLGAVVPRAALQPSIQQLSTPAPAHRATPNPWIHCLYFSVMVFFTFRLKQKILTFFGIHERRIIVTQWILGFLVYLAFLLGAQSGSILHQLKTLFVG